MDKKQWFVSGSIFFVFAFINLLVLTNYITGTEAMFWTFFYWILGIVCFANGSLEKKK